MPESKRNLSVDLARGVASLIMIQGHAYDGWVAPAYKDSEAYLFTRLLGTLPLPAFLVLSGAAVALRVDAAARRGEAAKDVRHALMRRGVQVVLWGYLVNVAYALMDGGQGLGTWLRADVLHVIGLSIFTLAWLGVRESRSGVVHRNGPPDAGMLQRAALGIGLVSVLACPALTAWARHASDAWWGYLIAPVGEVPGITRMPLVPLAAWACAGVLVARGVRSAETAVDSPSSRGHRGLVVVAGTGLLLAWVGTWATQALLAELGGRLSRSHAAVIPNAIDGAGRGLFVLGAGALAASALPRALRARVALLGRHSLIAYVFHIPFCYGSLGAPWRGRLDMPAASIGVLLLMTACFFAVWLNTKRPGEAFPGTLRRRHAISRG